MSEHDPAKAVEVADLRDAVIELAKAWKEWRTGYGGLLVDPVEDGLFDAVEALECHCTDETFCPQHMPRSRSGEDLAPKAEE
jgi:hypothetical protein